MVQSPVSSSATTGLAFEMRARLAAPGLARATQARDNNASADGTSASTKANELTAQDQQEVAQLRPDRSPGSRARAGAPFGRRRAGARRRVVPLPGRSGSAALCRWRRGFDRRFSRQYAAKTLPKAEHIRATALAPARPSAQDQSVAAQAQRMASEARMESPRCACGEAPLRRGMPVSIGALSRTTGWARVWISSPDQYSAIRLRSAGN